MPFAPFSPEPLKLITPEVIDKIREVIASTITPSWIASVPNNFGQAVAGTLKADEWRILANIYLPIALITIWGDGKWYKSDELDKFAAKNLSVSMKLFSAVRLVTLRHMSQSRMQAYRENLAAYVEGIKDLYPEFDIPTNFHMAIHIFDFLGLFGPVRSWWSFPFERLIGILQRQPSNHKIGEPFPCIHTSFS
jgi:hypothetical protein